MKRFELLSTRGVYVRMSCRAEGLPGAPAQTARPPLEMPVLVGQLDGELPQTAPKTSFPVVAHKGDIGVGASVPTPGQKGPVSAQCDCTVDNDVFGVLNSM